VLFWTIGESAEPSGKFINCVIEDSGNWRCPAGASISFTITNAMANGEPARDTSGSGRAYNRIAKWRWFLLSMGLPGGH